MINTPPRIGISGVATALLLVVGGGLIKPPGLLAAQPIARQPGQHEPLVRLLVPLESGHEFEQLLPIAPSAQLVAIDGRSYVLLGSFSDAVVAYRLGRTFQTRLRLPFELAYDHGHPQRDGGWLALHRPSTPPTPITPPPPPPLPQLALKQVSAPMAAPSTPLDPELRGLKPVAISPRQLLAVNSGLHYLFVKLQSPEQVVALRHHVPIAEMGERNGQLVARVGVFTPTREGRRLLQQQASRLAAIGYNLEVTHVNT